MACFSRRTYRYESFVSELKVVGGSVVRSFEEISLLMSAERGEHGSGEGAGVSLSGHAS